mgnify:CR=1 FL=1
MRELEISKKLILMCKLCYEDSRCCIRVGGVRSRLFEVDPRLLQGYPVAPMPFNLFLVMKQTGGEDVLCSLEERQ